MKLLFVCTQNRCRSVTAELLYSDNVNHEVKSAGTANDANKKISKDLLLWADKIFVFEKSHRNKIHKLFPDIYKQLAIECLYIEDLYEPMDPYLINLLKMSLRGKIGDSIKCP